MSGTPRRWSHWNGECLFLLVFALLGCEGEQVPPPDTLAECRTDADCTAEQRCEVDAPAARRLSIPMFVCPVCVSDSECATGTVCRPASQQDRQGYPCELTDNTCQVPCDEVGCGTGEVCRDSACVKVSCDEPDAPACPERWSCDPGSPREQYPDLTVGVAGSTDTTFDWAEASHFIAIGCIRNLCDAPDGFTCGNGWTCAPEDPGSYGTGCFPTPCEEWGGSCSSPRFVCEATNEFQRPAGTDPHGCLAANCLESDALCSGTYSDGVSTTASQRCAPDEDGASELGCVVRKCDEITEFDICGELETCSPTSPGANSIGCVNALCEKGDYECPEGGVCDPTHDAATNGGCVFPESEPPAGTAGAGGAGTGDPPGEAGANSGGSIATPAPPTGTASPANDDTMSSGGAPPNGGSPAGGPASTEGSAGGGGDGDDPAGETDGDDADTDEMSEDTNDDPLDTNTASVVGRCVSR